MASLLAPFVCEHPCWILADITGAIKHRDWPTGEERVSTGSLLKPFLALAYLRSGKNPPVLECRGQAAGCWSLRGHGKQNLVRALANSCNVYFRSLAAQTDAASLESVALRYGLQPPDRSWTPEQLIGLGEGWPQAPVAVVRAFGLLARSSAEPAAALVLQGLALCAREGTARAAQWPCYAKTGTAVCSHAHGGLGDGFTLAIYPLAEPRHVLLVTRHNTTGAETAREVKPLLVRYG